MFVTEILVDLEYFVSLDTRIIWGVEIKYPFAQDPT